MKKIIALLTAGLVLVAALSGCAGKTAQSMDGAAMPQTQTGVQTLSSKSEEQTTLEDNYEFSSEILAEPNDIRYTDVPGMPTQDFVLSFEDVKNEKTYDVTVEEPDKLTSNALSDIYNFVQTEQRKPVRYFDEEVQKAVEELLPNGVSVDILHMTEFMQVLLEKTEDKNSDAKATVIIDADYVPNRLVIVMIGDRQACKDDQDLDAIEWTPLKASVTEVGKIEFVLPAELLEKVEGDDIIFSVLTDRIGTHGGVIHYKDGEIIITYPSKTAEDFQKEYGLYPYNNTANIPGDSGAHFTDTVAQFEDRCYLHRDSADERNGWYREDNSWSYYVDGTALTGAQELPSHIADESGKFWYDLGEDGKCSGKLTYVYRRYHHIGKCVCPDCGFHSPESDYLATDVDMEKGTMTLREGGEEHPYRLISDSVPNLYNMVTVIAVLRQLGYSHEAISGYMSRAAVVATRHMEEQVGNVKLVRQMSKEKNALAGSRTFQYIAQRPGTKELLLMMNCLGDAHHWSENTCWIFDADFEYLCNDSVVQLVCTGARCRDYKLRLLMAGVPEERIVCEPDEFRAAELLRYTPGDDVYILYGTDSLALSYKVYDHMKEEAARHAQDGAEKEAQA